MSGVLGPISKEHVGTRPPLSPGLWILSWVVLDCVPCADMSVASAEMESQARGPGHCGRVFKSVHKRSEIKVRKGAVPRSPVNVMETLSEG